MKSDTQLQQDVLAELQLDPSVNAVHMGVEVHEGEVTLFGYADRFLEKWNAERAAARVSGVKAVNVEIKVNLPGFYRRSDSDIAAAATNALAWFSDIKPDQIKISVEQGWITLSGEVSWDYQRRALVAQLRHLAGIAGIKDQILIKPDVVMSATKSEIEIALKRILKTDQPTISVQVKGADICVEGKLNNLLERDLVQRSLWSTPGVHQVIDKIAIDLEVNT